MRVESSGIPGIFARETSCVSEPSFDLSKAARLARAIWQYGEPVHAVIYYASERKEATDKLGLKGGWMSYFGCRAAPLGAASAATVTAVFFNFHPTMIGRSIPDAWTYASPTDLLESRVTAMDAALRRVLGDEIVRSAAVGRAASLAATAVAECDLSGRPMGSANQAVAFPDEPHVKLWQALTTIREARGDGHVDSLVRTGISPSEALVLQSATGRSPEDGLRANRGWSDEEWDAAAAALLSRGWIDTEGRITAAGAEVRDEVEGSTDRLAEPIVTALGDGGAEELVALLRPLAERVMDSGAVPAHNNMGVPWPPP